jgi:2-polyprenyl-6-methoxyphenol hydroxylase-like FAD-dependent oxidoreductase
MGDAGTHAVVVGASMGGLLAARALIGPYDRVTILDRDKLPTCAESRKGVPQGRQVHVLLSGGAQLLGTMFPGILEELAANGVPVVREWSALAFTVGNHRLALPVGAVDPPAYLVSRPELELRVRGRVGALSGIEILDGSEVSGLLSTRGAERVTGVKVQRDGVEAELTADLVVDATGRTGRAPVWLAALGYAQAPEEELAIDLMYATRQVKATGADLDGVQATLIGHYPGMPRTFFAVRAEGERVYVTGAGYGAHQPPGDEAGFDAFVASVAPPRLVSALAAAEPLGPVITHRFPSNLRRHYQKLDRFPGGFLVFGDALCSFNPVYGEGMTVCAFQAQALRRCLSRGEDDLARRFFRAAAKPIEVAWQFSVGADLALPEIEGRRTARMRFLNRYIARLQAAAETEPAVSEAFLRVLNFLDPPARLFSPDILRRVLRPAAAAPAEPPSPPEAEQINADRVGAAHS